MSLTYLGSLSIGQLVPISVQSVAALVSTVGLVRAKVQGEIKAGLTLGAALTVTPPAFAANLTAVGKLSGRLQAALSGGVVPPGLVANPSAILSVVAQLQAYLAQIQAQVTAALDLAVTLSAAGIYSYSYGGQTQDFGPALTSLTASGLPSGSGPTAHCDALILAVSSPAVWTALQLVMAAPSITGIRYNGDLLLAGCIPSAVTASAGVSAAAAIAAPLVALKLLGLAQASLSVSLRPPSLTANVAAVGQITAGLTLALAGGVSPPGVGVNAQVTGNLAAIATAEAQLLALDALLALVASLTGAFGLGGISAYRYSGPVSSMGPSITAKLSTGLPGGLPTDSATALVLVTELSATWAAMSTALKMA